MFPHVWNEWTNESIGKRMKPYEYVQIPMCTNTSTTSTNTDEITQAHSRQMSDVVVVIKLATTQLTRLPTEIHICVMMIIIAKSTMISCFGSTPAAAVLLLLSCYSSCPAHDLILSYSFPAPAILLSCSCPAPAPAMLLPSSWPIPALLLPRPCHTPALLLLCFFPPKFGIFHQYQHLTTFFRHGE